MQVPMVMARSAWKIASATLSGYLDEVGQPTSLDDPSYNELTKIHVQNDIKTELISHLWFFFSVNELKIGYIEILSIYNK